MRISLVVGDYLKHSCPVLVAGCFEEDGELEWITRLDRAMEGRLLPLCRQEDFAGKLDKTKMVHTLGRLPAERILLVGLGKRKDFTVERLRRASGTMVQVLKKARLERGSSLLLCVAGDEPAKIRAVAEGALLGSYEFSQYKTAAGDESAVTELTFLCPDKNVRTSVESFVAEAVCVCDAVSFARDLVSQPGNVATPTYLAEKGLEMAARQGMTCQVLEREELERLGMEALLAVSRGSHQPPRFIILEYHGDGAKGRPVVLVGKGVTFDSGGISLKPGAGMERMKDDMAGAAAVLGTLQAAAALRLPLHLVGLVPAAENLPGGGAYKPGDVVTAMSGKTIEVINTDAEGRLLLCDALHYAQRYRPAALIDLATLTGACIVALGNVATGLMGNDNNLKRSLQRAGEASGERVWELPLWEEYGELMKSDIADVKNAGGPTAGTISAGWFLQQFAGKARWAHLDIAGTAWEEKGQPHIPKGATGVGVRLLIEYLRAIC
ncbi:leucyl aminopeptidase [Geobacter sp. AOG1]|uniref:leucyl aminopeptidase n=1 Tax=Geobacter sp. AOG1 TaxID=1566346 RepID=UPI001CC77264|nr:leucyl aminopeptidase [Geobacter sp. AOG1]GFE56900.1 putative cytosol aminopeptidase [Geobacter sp. AOG1]